MALSTPSLYTIPAFDATLDYTVTFSVSGGDQVVANRLIVYRNNDITTPVYNNVVESYNFNHIIPANTLTNGIYYVAYIKTYGVNDDITDENAGSSLSSGVPFYCYTTPVFLWDNEPDDSIIDTSSFVFHFLYSQAQNERLYSYIINLYDQTQTLISSSGTQYISSATVDIRYEVTGLLNSNDYYIEANGVTVNNTQITTGRKHFSVNYYEPYSKQGFLATNDPCNGWVTLTNNVVIIDSTSYPDPPNYVYENTAVDLTESGSYVRWIGFTQSGDFRIRIWGYNFTSNERVFFYAQDNIAYNITLTRRDGYDYQSNVLQNYYELQVQTNDSQPLFIYSNYINQPDEDDQIFICIKRINNMYSLYIENLG